MNGADERDDPVTKALRVWSGAPGLTGCLFAGGVEKHVRVWCAPVDPQYLGAELEAALTVAAEQPKLATLAFPRVSTVLELAELVATIGSSSPSWGLWERTCNAPDLRALELMWKTGTGLWSSALCVGPFPFFPVTRRAPYTAFLLWPTASANGLSQRPGPQVLGIGDAPPKSLDRTAYLERIRQTSAQVREMATAPSAAAPQRTVSVHLPHGEATGLVLSPQDLDPRGVVLSS